MFHSIIITESQLGDEVEKIVRLSEVRAVVNALKAGERPCVGQLIDYFIEPPGSGPDSLIQQRGFFAKREKPYRVAVEQWHLDAAHQMLASLSIASLVNRLRDTDDSSRKNRAKPER